MKPCELNHNTYIHTCMYSTAKGQSHACRTRGTRVAKKVSRVVPRVYTRVPTRLSRTYVRSIYVSMHALAAGASRHAHSTASSALVLLANILLSWYLYTSLQERRKLPLRPNNENARPAVLAFAPRTYNEINTRIT